MPMDMENLDIAQHQDLLCYTIIHKKKSCPLSPPHIFTIVQFDYISITFSLLKFVGDLLHYLMVNIVHNCYIHYVIDLWV
jgi:hypothetical protein